MGVQAIKHEAKLAEWTEKMQQCRSSGKSVKGWCDEQGIRTKVYYYWEKQIVEKATQKQNQLSGMQAGTLMRINGELLPGKESLGANEGITIRHGESSIVLLAGSSVQSIAELVKALNRHV